MTILYLIRHGETAGNSEGRFQGIVDNPLNESGMQQAQMLGMAFSLSRVDVLYTSPLLRARQTAQMIAQMHGLQKLEPVVEPVALILVVWTWEISLEISLETFLEAAVAKEERIMVR